MLQSTMRILTIVCCVAVLSALASVCAAQGCSSCAAAPGVAPAYTTYMAPSYTTYMAPNYAYMPTPVYQATYRPAYVAAYAPAYQSYAVTTYRPLFGGWSTRMVPYTTYQPVYTPVASVAYYGCATCPTYTSGCNSCGSCSSYGTVNYAAPTSGCASCAAGASTPTVVSPAPASNNGQAVPPKTFEEKAQKPVAEPDVKPIPQTETKFNSMPSPLLPDPRDRTVSSTTRVPVRVALTASSSQAAPVQDNDGWQPARD